MSATICRSGIGNVKMELWNFNDHLMILRIMKRIIMSIGVIVAAIFTLTNCNKEMDAPQQPDQKQGVPFEFSASILTKTANQGEGTIWSAGDAVNLYHSVASASSYVSNGSFAIAEEDLEEGKFRGELASALESGKSYDWVAFYPYDAANTAPSSVTVSLGSAVQTGDNNMTHVAGENFPLWGVAKNVNGDLQMQLNHLSSLLEVEVLNSTSEEIIVSSVALTAQEDIAGEFTVDLTSEAPAFAAVAGKTSNTSILTVNSAQNIGKGASAKYYLAVKPFTAAAGSNLILSVNGIDYEIELSSDVVFSAGNIKPLKFDYDKTGAPAVTIKNVAFSSADLEWTTDGLAKSFNIYVNGEKVVSDIAADVLTYHLTGLETGKESVIEVEAVGDHNAAKSAGQTVKTAGVRLVYVDEHHAAIEWDDLVGGETYGSSGRMDHGYHCAIYTDSECTKLHYEVYPYNGRNSYEYAFSNSSYIGKKGGTNYYIPTRLAFGSLQANTTYYFRVRTFDGYDYTYKDVSYKITNKFGTSEYSQPLEFKTAARQPWASDVVVFNNFDELACQVDYRNGCPGTVNRSVSDVNNLKNIGIYAFSVTAHELGTWGFTYNATGTAGEYFNGSTYNGQTNKIGKAGYDFEGWHCTGGMRPAQGAILFDWKNDGVLGTPALERNLVEGELRPCVLTFEAVAIRNGADPSSTKVELVIIRDGKDILLKTLSIPYSYKYWNDTSNYEVDFTLDLYTEYLALKKGDAVALRTADGSARLVIDNFKIVVSDVAGDGSLEIPDWGDDGDGLEI